MGNQPGPLAEFWVRVRIDGHDCTLRVTAADAARQPRLHLHQNKRMTYATRQCGQLIIDWDNVATLEPGPATRADSGSVANPLDG